MPCADWGSGYASLAGLALSVDLIFLGNEWLGAENSFLALPARCISASKVLENTKDTGIDPLSRLALRRLGSLGLSLIPSNGIEQEVHYRLAFRCVVAWEDLAARIAPLAAHLIPIFTHYHAKGALHRQPSATTFTPDVKQTDQTAPRRDRVGEGDDPRTTAESQHFL